MGLPNESIKVVEFDCWPITLIWLILPYNLIKQSNIIVKRSSMVEPNLTYMLCLFSCFCVHKMLKEMVQLPSQMIPLKKEPRVVIDHIANLKGTHTDRGAEPDHLWTEVDTKPISKKDLEFEYRYSPKKSGSCYRRAVISRFDSQIIDFGKSYEAEVRRLKQQRPGMRPRHSTMVK